MEKNREQTPLLPKANRSQRKVPSKVIVPSIHCPYHNNPENKKNHIEKIIVPNKARQSLIREESSLKIHSQVVVLIRIPCWPYRSCQGDVLPWKSFRALHLLRLIGLSVKAGGWGAAGEVAGEDWLEEGAEDDLGTAGCMG
jgi:hypothetical protein